MRQPKTFLLLSIIVAVLILGVAYAAISNINLEITGTAQVDPSQANFDVRFLSTTDINFGNYSFGNNGKITGSAKVTGNTTAEIVVSGMSRMDDYAEATFTVKNYSEDLAAKITAYPTMTGDHELFDIICPDFEFGGGYMLLQPGEQHEFSIIITLNKTLITEEPVANVKVTVTATPVYAGYYDFEM